MSASIDQVDLATTIKHLEEHCKAFSSYKNEATLNDICDDIRCLTSSSNELANKSIISNDGISVITEALKCVQNKETLYVRLAVDVFRCLRNLCAFNECFQEEIAKNPLLLNLSKNIVMEMAAVVTSKKTEDEKKYEQCFRCAVQFWGNLVVNNTYNKKLIWFEMKDVIRNLLLNIKDDVLINYISMLLYNCLHDEPEIIQNFLKCGEMFIDVCFQIIDAASIKDIEWGLYLLLSFLSIDGFMHKIYDNLSLDGRLFLLEVTEHALDNKTDKISQDNILYLSETLKKNWNHVLRASEIDSKEPTVLLKLLEILCTISATDVFKELQNDVDLLTTILHLLKSVHTIGKQSTNSFSPIVKLSSVANPEEVNDSPANGLKRDLVRMIGNLCWKCKKNQDHVRELDGIPLLLDCCNIDARNPFIIQWVVFAIRNLCENNLENQNLIASMRQVGSVESDVLNELKLGVTHEEESAINERNISSTCDSNTMQRNLSDIDELFN